MQHGGKLIGQGSFGCAFRPMIPCKGSNKREKGIVSKLISKKDAQEELSEALRIDELDPTGIYHFTAPKMCEMDKAYKREEGINRCHPYTNKGRSISRMRLLQYKDGGTETAVFLTKHKKDLLDKPSYSKRFILGLEPIMYGLKDMYEKGFMHFDIKTQNMVTNPRTLQTKYIDFGLASTVAEAMYSPQVLYRFGVGYFAYPLECALPSYDIYNIRNKPRFVYRSRKIMEKLYNESYMSYIDEQNIYQGSLYKGILEEEYIKKYRLNLQEMNREEVVRRISEKLDVFSVGVALAEIFVAIRGRMFNWSHKNPDMDPIQSQIYDLVKLMTQPYYEDRINGSVAYEFYMNNIKPLCEPKKKVKEIKPPPKSSVAAPDVEELVIEQKEKECPANKVYNPVTNRCVLKTGAIGKRILQEKAKDEKKAQEEKVKDEKECPSDKILNPKTGRCVLRTGAMGKKLLAKKSVKKVAKKASVKKTVKKGKKECPSDKILNPKTGRCVLKTGALGKKLLAKKSVKKVVKKPRKKTQKKLVIISAPKSQKIELRSIRMPGSAVV